MARPRYYRTVPTERPVERHKRCSQYVVIEHADIDRLPQRSASGRDSRKSRRVKREEEEGRPPAETRHDARKGDALAGGQMADTVGIQGPG